MPADPAAVKSVFLEAVELSAADRSAFLAGRCGTDADLRRRVDALLAAHDAAGEGAGTASFADGAETADRPGKDEHVGAVLAGKYKLVEAIGEGGMGAVYLAQQTEPVKRAVAVKVIKAGMDSKAVLARFEAERQALALMDHPHIARVLDAGTTDTGRPFFVMELVKGIPITKFCDERKLTPRQRLELFVPVCQAIQHAHQKGVIHRDIKPSNVLVALYDDRPVPKVIDFGVAKAAGPTLTDKTLLTGFGAVVGTPEYMSPEQASLNNLDVDTRSDVYSLGVLLYELLTGSTPVDRKSLGKAALMEVLRVVREVEPPKPSAKLSTLDTLPSVAANRGTEPAKLSKLMKGELDWLVLKALEKDRTRRYDTANGLAADVQRYLAGEPVQAVPPSAGYRLRKIVRRHKGTVTAASLVLLALLAGIAGTTYGLVRAEERRREAEQAIEREAERADGERKAKELAVAEKDRAVKAEADVQAVLKFVVDRVFAAARPVGIGLGKDVTLRQALDAAVPHIADDFAQVPRAEVSLRKTLGTVYRLSEDHPLASSQYSLALAVARKKLGENDPLVFDVEINAAGLLVDTSKTDQACVLLEDVLGRLERQTPRDETTIRLAVGALALAYIRNGQEEMAHRTEKRAVVAPPVDRVGAILREAIALFRQKRWSEAVDAYLRALDEMKADWKPAYSRERFSVAQTIVGCLRMANRQDEAMAFGHQMYSACRAEYGPHDKLTEVLSQSLINVYCSTAPSAEHAEFIRDRLKEKTDKWGPGNANLSPDVINLSHIYGLLGRHKDAIDVLESYTAAIPEPKRAESVNYAFVVGNLSESYAAVGRRREAVTVVSDHIERLKRIGLSESTRQGSVLHLANILGDLGEWPAAVRSCEHVLAERRKIDPPDWRVHSARERLGWALTGAKRYEEAEMELLAAYRGLTDTSHPLPEAARDRPRDATDQLIRLYTKWGKQDEAAKWEVERAKYPREVLPPPRRER